MRKKIFIWELFKEEKAINTKRYCPQCKKAVLFTDSLKRRKNANGKTIYAFAIYKCGKDHTWNKKLSSFKAGSKEEQNNNWSVDKKDSRQKTIDLTLIRKCGYDVVEIHLKQVKGKWRLDALLADNLADISRAQIKKMIHSQYIILDRSKTKVGSFVYTGQTIVISLNSQQF